MHSVEINRLKHNKSPRKGALELCNSIQNQPRLVIVEELTVVKLIARAPLVPVDPANAVAPAVPDAPALKVTVCPPMLSVAALPEEVAKVPDPA